MSNIEIGNRIKTRRQKLNLTQGDIANDIGVAVSTIQRYEAGTIEKLKIPVIEAIARSLQVSPEWLIGKSTANESPLASENIEDDRLSEINQIYHKLNDDGQELMLANARSLHALGKYNAVPPGSSAEPAI